MVLTCRTMRGDIFDLPERKSRLLWRKAGEYQNAGPEDNPWCLAFRRDTDVGHQSNQDDHSAASAWCLDSKQSERHFYGTRVARLISLSFSHEF
jgi:hypothetical protein